LNWKRLKAIPLPMIIGVLSILVGVLLFLLIIGQQPSANLEDDSTGFSVNAEFRDEVLVIHIRNLNGEEVGVSTVYLIRQNYMDYEMLVNEVVKPRGELEIETNIKQPKQHGTYKVISNGSTLECDVEIP